MTDVARQKSFSKADEAQLRQLYRARWSGVWAGDLICKPSARMLVAQGYAENKGGSPSSLDRVYISRRGVVVVQAWDHWND